ncbi:MAG TPA: AMP-binding protein [Burkholderiales bacterium]
MSTYAAQIAYLFARSGFYHRKLGAAGFDSPVAVGGLERIAALPFTTKDELRASQAEVPPLGAHAAIRLEQAARIYSTSGTSGAPSYIPLTRGDLDDWRRIARESYARSGLQPGELLLSTYNAGPFVAGAALDAFDSLGVTHMPMGTGQTERLLEALKRFRPHTLVCTPSYGLYLSERDPSLKQIGLKRVLVAGEPGGGEPAFRRQLEERFGARVYEVMGIGDIAASLWGECQAQAGMHFSGAPTIHVELVDPESGRPRDMHDGAEGELVYTHLRREAAPLLRFRSRDHVRISTSPCACGLASLRVRCIGRTDDMLIVRGVNVFPSAIREVVSRFEPQVTGAVLVRPRRRGVRQDPPLPLLVETSHAELAGPIRDEIRAVLAVTTDVNPVPPGSLPRSEYKSKLLDYSEAEGE